MKDGNDEEEEEKNIAVTVGKAVYIRHIIIIYDYKRSLIVIVEVKRKKNERYTRESRETNMSHKQYDF